jgi:hypothetical protein
MTTKPPALDTLKTQSEIATAYADASAAIRNAEAANRSESTLNRLYNRYFKLETMLKSCGGF